MGNQAEIVKLPRYSPYLNGYEIAGSFVKAAIKRKLSEPAIQHEIYQRNHSRHETLHNRRLRILRREIELSLHEITAHKCMQWCNHTMTCMSLYS